MEPVARRATETGLLVINYRGRSFAYGKTGIVYQNTDINFYFLFCDLSRLICSDLFITISNEVRFLQSRLKFAFR